MANQDMEALIAKHRNFYFCLKVRWERKCDRIFVYIPKDRAGEPRRKGKNGYVGIGIVTEPKCRSEERRVGKECRL